MMLKYGLIILGLVLGTAIGVRADNKSDAIEALNIKIQELQTVSAQLQEVETKVVFPRLTKMLNGMIAFMAPLAPLPFTAITDEQDQAFKQLIKPLGEDQSYFNDIKDLELFILNCKAVVYYLQQYDLESQIEKDSRADQLAAVTKYKSNLAEFLPEYGQVKQTVLKFLDEIKTNYAAIEQIKTELPKHAHIEDLRLINRNAVLKTAQFYKEISAREKTIKDSKIQLASILFNLTNQYEAAFGILGKKFGDAFLPEDAKVSIVNDVVNEVDQYRLEGEGRDDRMWDYLRKSFFPMHNLFLDIEFHNGSPAAFLAEVDAKMAQIRARSRGDVAKLAALEVRNRELQAEAAKKNVAAAAKKKADDAAAKAAAKKAKASGAAAEAGSGSREIKGEKPKPAKPKAGGEDTPKPAKPAKPKAGGEDTPKPAKPAKPKDGGGKAKQK